VTRKKNKTFIQYIKEKIVEVSVYNNVNVKVRASPNTGEKKRDRDIYKIIYINKKEEEC